MFEQRSKAVNLGHAQIQKIPSWGPNIFLSSNYFTEGHTDFPGEAKGPSASGGWSVPNFGNL